MPLTWSWLAIRNKLYYQKQTKQEYFDDLYFKSKYNVVYRKKVYTQEDTVTDVSANDN